MAQRSDIHDVRICGVNDNAAYMMGVLESHVCPGLPPIRGFIHTVPPRRALTVVRLARPNPNSVRLRGGHSHIADRAGRLIIEDGLPCYPVVRGLPYSSGSRPHVYGIGIALHHRKIIDSSTHIRRTDTAPFEPLQDVSLEARCGRPFIPLRPDKKKNREHQSHNINHSQITQIFAQSIPPSFECLNKGLIKIFNPSINITRKSFLSKPQLLY